MEFVEAPKADGDNNINNNNAFAIEMKEIEENENKIIKKIQIQKEEIEKTKILLTQIESCFEAQEQMLNNFLAKQLEIKNRKLNLLNNYENCSNNFVDLTNVAENNTNQIISDCGKLIQNKDLKRKHSDNEEIEVKEKRLNKEYTERERIEFKISSQTINKDSYELRVISKLRNKVIINKIQSSKNIIYICGSDGFFAECYTQVAIIKKLFTNTTENIVDMLRIKDKIFAFTVNSMILIVKNNSKFSASIIKIFQSNISRNVHLRGYMIFIPLQDGTVWQFDYEMNSIKIFYQSSSVFTKFLFIKKDLSMLLINDSLIALEQDRERTLLKNGCTNIDIYSDTSLICTFEKKILIVNLQNEKAIFRRSFSDCVILTKASRSVLVVLDSKNKLHIFVTKKKYKFEDMAVIQLPIEHEIRAILPTLYNEVIFSTDKAIYEIKF